MTMTTLSFGQQHSGRYRSRVLTHLCLGVGALTVATACGSSSDSSEASVPVSRAEPDRVQTSSTPDEIDAPTSTAPPETTTPPTSLSTEPPSTDPPITETSIDPADVPYPGAALPILTVHETALTLTSLESVDGALFAGAGEVVVRIDVDTAEQMNFLIPEEQDVRGSSFYLTRAGQHLLVASQSQAVAVIDHVTAIAPDSMERVGVLRTPLMQIAGPMGSFGSSTGTTTPIFRGEYPNGSSSLFELDIETMTVSDQPLPYDIGPGSAFVARIDAFDWVWRLDGTGSVHQVDGGTEVTTFDLGYSLGSGQHGLVASDEASVWHADRALARLSRFDRRSGALTDQVDLAEHFGPDAVVRLAPGDFDGSYLTAQVLVDGRSWYVLLDLDLESGTVKSQHVIAENAFEFGWTGPLAVPYTETIGDRLFVMDHRRRVVEVDVAKLGETSATAWEFSGISTGAVLTAEEQEIADLMFVDVDRMRNDEPRIASTDAELSALEGAFNLGSGALAGGLEPAGVTIDGDRAWGWMNRTDNEGIGVPFMFVRVDGQWLLDADSMCLFISSVADLCGVGAG